MNNDLIDVKTLKPLTRFIYTIGILPTSYLMSMTYEEQLVWLCNYLAQTVIPTINNNGKAVEELQELYKELKDYVDNFIDTLDIQTEVDNKLEEMYENGQLAEIIAQFLEYAGVFGFDTKEELKANTSFVNGSIAMTLGETTYNDGKINFYRIRNYLTTDIIDDNNILAITNDPTLIAEKIHNYYINDLYNKALENKNLINFNKIHDLADNVQANLFKDISNTFDISSGWAVSSCIITNVNNVNKGIIAANDWSSSGNKFNIVTFDFINENVTNITTRAELLNGHSNSMCEIGNNKVLICANGYNYIYDLLNNTYVLVENDLPYFSMVANDENGNIYAAQDYDYTLSQVVNALYELDVDNINNTIEIKSTKTIPNLREKIQENEQGMVIYNGLLIFPSFSNCKLCIYELNSLNYLKTQLFTAPYEVEYEDGFIYNNELLLIDSLGRLFKPDIYNKNAIGGYDKNNITKSLTDICLYDDVIEISPGESKTIKFEKYFTFMSYPNGDTGSFGKQLESITIYCAIRTYPGSGGVHNLQPIEIPMYKNITYQNNPISWYAYHWQTYYEESPANSNAIDSKHYCGTFNFGPGDSAPSFTITLANTGYERYISSSGETVNVIPSSIGFKLYITKIIGHRKVGLNY